jgi:hypothetical protein
VGWAVGPAVGDLVRLPWPDAAQRPEHALGCQLDAHAPVVPERVDQPGVPAGPM